ncbi:MAG: SOS response-associated peptidase [Caldilineaceae bacterium]
MCGRFVLRASPEQLRELFDLQDEPYVEPRYNIAPTQPVAIVRLHQHNKEREWTHVQWGLIPSWAKDPSIGQKMINARSETVGEKASYRAAFKRRRCLVPASGFYEWQKGATGKTPHFITTDQGLFAIAGLWERWVEPGGAELESCTLLTTEANERVSALHDRMPVIVDPADFDQWLGHGGDSSPGELAQLQHLLRPWDAERTVLWPVSTRVNSVRNEGAENLERVSALS